MPPETTSRRLAWFSCGAASAVAAYYGNADEILYCDTLAYEHPDNLRFLADVGKWCGKEIKILGSDKYTDIYDVFDKTGWLVGPRGARCTTELKKNVRKAYQQVDDVHVFGFTAEEGHRIERFKRENPELYADFPLVRLWITKAECFEILKGAGIELPAMYQLGYKNNNCIGCVKGGMGYWNKVRKDFPHAFEKMAKQERKMGVSVCRDKGGPVFLDGLSPSRGRYEAEADFECGVLCGPQEVAYAS
jgi:hypothetical protein